MSYSNTGPDIINDILYTLRLEYTGYVNIELFTNFVNDIMLSNYVTSVNNIPDQALALTFPKLRVVTNNITTGGSFKLPPIKSENLYGNQPLDYSRLFPIPKMSFNDDGTDNRGKTQINSIYYPNIARIAKITVIDDDLDPQIHDVDGLSPNNIDLDFKGVEAILTSSRSLDIARKRYYRKPSENRVYAVLHAQTQSYSVLEVTTDKNYIVLEYYRYPYPLDYDDSDTLVELSELQLNLLKEAAKVKFLERIKDERFNNYISKKG